MRLIKPAVLVRVSTAAINHHDQKQAGQERVYLAYTSTVLFIIGGSQDRNSNRAGNWKQELMQSPWRVLLTGLFPMACSACFLIELRTISAGMAPHTAVWVLSHQSLTKGCLSAGPYGSIFSIVVHPSFQMTLACVQLT